jgi:hypothetical protein
MKKFLIVCSEVVYYDIEVMAETESEAIEIVMSGEADFVVSDSDRFDIESVVDISDEIKKEDVYKIMGKV